MFSGRDGLRIVWSKAACQSEMAWERSNSSCHYISGREEEALRVWHMVTSQMTPLGVRCVYWLKEEGPGSCREISAWPRMRNLQHWGCFRDLLEGPIFVYFAPIIDKFSLSLVFLLAFVSRNNTEHGNTAQCVMISSLQRSQQMDFIL